MKKILISLLVISLIISPVFSKPNKDPKPPKVTKGEKGDTGKQGVKGDSGLQGIAGQGLKDQYIGSIGLRLWDCQRHSAEISYGYDFNNNNNIIEAKIVVKFGKSYLDRKLEELEKKIKEEK